MASGTGLLDVHELAWDAELLAATGIVAEQLSPLVDLGPSGRLEQSFSSRLPTLRTADWVPALGDGACANVGAGAVGPQRLALTVGTSAAIRMVLPRSADSDWTIPTGLWAYRLDSEHAVLGGALSNGGNMLRWIGETTGTLDDEETAAIAAALPPDATGLTVLPFLAGERSPSWYDDARAVFAGLSLSTRPADLIRAGMESVAYRLAEIYSALSTLAAPDHVIAVNGGAVIERPAWLQIISDTLGHSLVALPAGDESTARGAAIVAAVAGGHLPSLTAGAEFTAEGTSYAPDRARHTRYLAGLERQRRLERLLSSSEFL
jgi:gluconokinase